MTSNANLPGKLKKAREKKDLSREQLSRQTGISEEFIHQLETGKYDGQGDVYTIGKLRFLADFLGLSADEAEELYVRETPEPSGKSGRRIRRDDKVRSPIVTSSVAVQAVVFSALALMLGYILWQVFLLASNPRLDLTYPEENQTITTEEIDIVGYTTPGSEVTIDGQPVLVADDGSFRYSVNLDDGTHVFNLEARSSLGRTSSLERTVIVDTEDD